MHVLVCKTSMSVPVAASRMARLTGAARSGPARFAKWVRAAHGRIINAAPHPAHGVGLAPCGTCTICPCLNHGFWTNSWRNKQFGTGYPNCYHRRACPFVQGRRSRVLQSSPAQPAGRQRGMITGQSPTLPYATDSASCSLVHMRLSVQLSVNDAGAVTRAGEKA